MTRQRKHAGMGALGLMLLSLATVSGWSQEPATVPPPAAETPAQAPAPPPDQVQAPAQPPAQTSPQGPPPPKLVPPAKKGKEVYTGPTTTVVLPPTPMLDEEGKQRTDPEGKPMFNPPVMQQRDKNGHPLFEGGKPVMQTPTELGYDEHGKKLHTVKEKPPKTIAVSVIRGTLTVDGLIGKAALNYEIADLRYIYLYAPWIGTVVVSNTKFPGATEEQKAFNQHTLTVTVEDHTFELYSEKILLGKNPEPAYVLVDREFKLGSSMPAMGYGLTSKAPYSWPGAKANPASKSFVQPPPVPVNLRPVMLLPPCPAGQMRAARSATDMGDPSKSQPCVPIATGTQVPPAAAPAPPPAAPPAAPPVR